VTPRFFEVTGQRLVSGRLLLETDDERTESPQVVVVNEALVRRDFDGRDAIGQRFHLSDTTFATIVGVVSDIRNAGPFREAQPEMYWTYAQRQPSASSVTVLVRTRSGNPASVASAVRQAVRDVDAEAAVARVETMSEVIAGSLGRPRFYFSLLGTFAGIAIVLAVAGLYGVLSYAVAQRTREIGIRSALGGSRAALIRLFAAEGLRLVGLGLMLGIAGGMAATRLMEFMLYGVSPLDAGTWAAAAALMIVAALGAVLVPALRAARVSPAIAMQAE
jgi:predicted lysophospholipase L1 biosynthesis ABC-type transport system permease subunit